MLLNRVWMIGKNSPGLSLRVRDDRRALQMRAEVGVLAAIAWQTRRSRGANGPRHNGPGAHHHHRCRLLSVPPHHGTVQGQQNMDPVFHDTRLIFDPGRTALPRVAALLMLRSTISTVSAPATYPYRGSITQPIQLLCTLRGRRCRRLTQHSLPGGPLRPCPDRSFAGWTAPALAGAFGNPG